MGAILCNKCGMIIKSGLSKAELRGKTDLVYCNKCAKEVLEKHLKIKA